MTMALNYSKALVLNMEKKGVVDIPKMPVKLAVDSSGSMDHLYNEGWVEDMLVVFAGAAMTFDDNKALEVGFFSYDVRVTPDITEKDPAEGYLQRHRIYANGGTSFCPILDKFAKTDEPTQKGGFFSRILRGNNETSVVGKNYLAIITDGDASDKELFKRRLGDIPKSTFVQIIGIGHDVPTKFLQSCDDLYDNVDFRHIPDPRGLTQDAMLELIANEEFVEFIKD